MATATIYSTVGYNHARSGNWNTARAGGGSIAVNPLDGNSATGRIVLVLSSPNYVFYRSYFQFDLSPIPTTAIIESMELQIQSVGYTTTQTIYFGYGGTTFLNGSSGEYNSVYDSRIGTTPLATINNWEDGIFSSSSLDIVTYPPTLIEPGKGEPPYWAPYVIGGVTDPDWNNTTNGTASELRFYGSAPTGNQRPKLIVTYTAGYPNIVIGVSGANISTISGVSSANIANIMGV